jgi:hypothetical protein
MPSRLVVAALLLSFAAPMGARAGNSAPVAETSVSAGRSLEELNSSPIQDNSFLVEEAYNQEDGVVQHISVFQKLSTGDWAFTQTDEWPPHSLKHQLSVTLAATHSGDFSGSGAGWGDTAINYRLSACGKWRC